MVCPHSSVSNSVSASSGEIMTLRCGGWVPEGFSARTPSSRNQLTKRERSANIKSESVIGLKVIRSQRRNRKRDREPRGGVIVSAARLQELPILVQP